MSIRIGVAAGADVDPTRLPELVDRLEATGVDSLWFSELVYSPAVDPTVGMAFALARTTRLKVGTSVAILPGRHPVLVAKQLVSLARLAPKRVLPVFGLQPANADERALFPVSGRRGDVFDEAVALLRTALDADGADFVGEHFDLKGVAVRQGLPRSPDIWLGGRSPGAFRRIGRLADGWLGSFLTTAEAAAAVTAITEEAHAADRTIDDDHFGVTVLLADGADPDALAARIGRQRPDVDPHELVATSWPQLHRLLDGYIAAGLSKFVVAPLGGTPMDLFLDRFVGELIPRQT